jgi:CRP-like cAMP-binding protein
MVDEIATVEKGPQVVTGKPIKPTEQNTFLAQLSRADYELFRPHLTPFQLTVGQRLQDFGHRSDQVIFPHGGLAAMTMPMRGGHGRGAIVVGRDGIVGAFEAAAAAPGLCNAEVYIPGRAARMPASAFRDVLDQSPAIRQLITRYLAALTVQVQQTALCNGVHPVEARISRWLLDIQDRCGGSDVPLTQATMAQMLGVQRTTVNLVARRLAAAGVIICRRACLDIVNREQLERHACECRFSLKSYLSTLFKAHSVT